VQEGEPFFHLCSRHAKYFTKVKHGVANREVSEKSYVLQQENNSVLIFEWSYLMPMLNYNSDSSHAISKGLFTNF
jgi:hypothetical protein